MSSQECVPPSRDSSPWISQGLQFIWVSSPQKQCLAVPPGTKRVVLATEGVTDLPEDDLAFCWSARLRLERCGVTEVQHAMEPQVFGFWYHRLLTILSGCWAKHRWGLYPHLPQSSIRMFLPDPLFGDGSALGLTANFSHRQPVAC